MLINLCPQRPETRLRAFVSSKSFWGNTLDPLFKEEGEGQGRVGLEGMEGRKWERKLKRKGRREREAGP
jgi:hypothetical protein